jgi:hypothetical protein
MQLQCTVRDTRGVDAPSDCKVFKKVVLHCKKSFLSSTFLCVVPIRYVQIVADVF